MTAHLTHDMSNRQAAAVLIAQAVRWGRTPNLPVIAAVTGMPTRQVDWLRDRIMSGHPGSLDGLPLDCTPQPGRR